MKTVPEEKKKKFDVLAIFEKVFGKFRNPNERQPSTHRRCRQCGSRYQLSRAAAAMEKFSISAKEQGIEIHPARVNPQLFCSPACGSPAPKPREQKESRQVNRARLGVSAQAEINRQYPNAPRRQRRHVARMLAHDQFRQLRRTAQ
jgi:ribosomal protein L37E